VTDPTTQGSPRRFILTLACPDRVGVVAAVTGCIAEHGGWVVEAAQHGDLATGRFFMRVEVLADSLPFGPEGFAEVFTPVADEFAMTWRVSDTAVPKRVVILVSREDHCLDDLLHRWRTKAFDFDVAAVISNHDDLRAFVEWHGIPFHHVPMTATNKADAFEEVARLFDAAHADVMVLARFMQIIPPELCDRYAGRIINIHHSFLPSFAGARPYQQAFERGVKLIGATCHYVTADLDQGPIIEQDVNRIDHGDTVQQLVRVGRDVERTVLARGVRFHVEDRVLINGNQTVVFA
jgi:formyltetrahydrofolate deformylase